MKTANSVNLKWLKIFHLFAAILWMLRNSDELAQGHDYAYYP